jgi:hypothetical protein
MDSRGEAPIPREWEAVSQLLQPNAQQLRGEPNTRAVKSFLTFAFKSI